MKWYIIGAAVAGAFGTATLKRPVTAAQRTLGTIGEFPTIAATGMTQTSCMDWSMRLNATTVVGRVIPTGQRTFNKKVGTIRLQSLGKVRKTGLEPA